MSAQLKRLLEWTQQREDIRAALMVGSRSHIDREADAFADYDLELFSDSVDQYRTLSRAFAEQFGELWVMLAEDQGDAWPSYLLLYADGTKLDITFAEIGKLQTMVDTGEFRSVFERGYKVLYDPDQIAAQLRPAKGLPEPITKPDAEAFQQVIERFWYGAIYVAKQIRRRNLWTVQYSDWTMKGDLLTMMEWHARYVREIGDTWHEGRHIQEWVDDGTRAMLRYAFPHFSAGDSWRALRTTMKVFSRLAPAVAETLGHPYPANLVDDMRAYIVMLYDSDHHLGTGDLS